MVFSGEFNRSGCVMPADKIPVTIVGQTYLVNERQFVTVNRLQDAIVSICRGETVAAGCVEVGADGRMRGCYHVTDDFDDLLRQWDEFGKLVAAAAVTWGGNAPPANRTLSKQ